MGVSLRYLPIKWLCLVFDELIVEYQSSICFQLKTFLAKPKACTADHFGIILKHLTNVVIEGTMAIDAFQGVFQMAAIEVKEAVASILGQLPSWL